MNRLKCVFFVLSAGIRFRYPVDKNKIKAYGQLVLLGFAVASFTPVAYQRNRLLRPFVCK